MPLEPTTLYIHNLTREWIDKQAKFHAVPMTGYLRRIIREHIKWHDPESWKKIAEAMQSEIEGNEATGG